MQPKFQITSNPDANLCIRSDPPLEQDPNTRLSILEHNQAVLQGAIRRLAGILGDRAVPDLLRNNLKGVPGHE